MARAFFRPFPALACLFLLLDGCAAETRRSGPINQEEEEKLDSGSPSGGRGGGGSSGAGGKGGSGAGGMAGSGGSTQTGGTGGVARDSGAADTTALPDSGGAGVPDAQPVAAAPKLSTDIAPFVKMRCAVAGCHDPVKHEHNMDVSTPAGIMNSWVNKVTADHCQNNKAVTRVVPGMPENSFVIKLITSTNYCSEIKRMPPPPLATLTPAQIALIRDWIAAGARND